MIKSGLKWQIKVLTKGYGCGKISISNKGGLKYDNVEIQKWLCRSV